MHMERLKAAVASVIIVLLAGTMFLLFTSTVSKLMEPKDVYESGDVLRFIEEAIGD